MTNQTDLAELRARVRELESASRTLRRLLLAALAGIAAPWLVGAGGEATTVEADRFVLRGSAGEARGVWSVDPEGGVEMSIRDPNGGERLILSVAGDGRPAIELRDEEERPRVRLVLARESSLNFYDRAARLRAALGVTSYGPTPIRMRPGGLWSPVGALRDFFGGWLERSPEPEPEAPLAPPRNEEDGPVLKLYDPGGKPRLKARVDGELPFVFLHTERGTIQRVLTEEVREEAP